MCRRQADGGEKKHPVKRGDDGDQPGREPGLEEHLSSRLVRRLGGTERLRSSCSCRGYRDKTEVVFTFQRAGAGKAKCEGKGSLEVVGSGERLAAGGGAGYRIRVRGRCV